MPTTRPGYIWSGTEWVAIGQEAAVNPFSYQATPPSSPATGDIWVDSDETVNSIDSTQFLRWRKTMVGGETSLSGNDDASLPLGYTPGYEQLYINGVLQVRGQDYLATTGTTVTGLTALVAGDTVEVFSAVARAVSDVYTQSQSDARFVNRNVGGLNLVVPTAVSVGSGTGTVSANGAVSFSGASSIAMDGVFTSSYQNYKLVLNVSANTISGGAAIRYYGRTAGTDVSTNYASTYVRGNGSTVNSFGTSTGDLGGTASTYANLVHTETLICNPQLATPTTTQNINVYVDGSGVANVQNIWSRHYANNQFDGLKVYVDSGTFSGTIRIYGYNNGA